MKLKEIEMRLGKQISRLETLKAEIESGADDASFERYNPNVGGPPVGLMDDETIEKYIQEYDRFRDVIQHKGFGLNNRRSEMEIIANILDIARKGVNKTRILYNANLSYVQLKNYVGFMLDKGLMENVEGKYSTTNKGKLFLITWQNTLALLD